MARSPCNKYNILPVVTDEIVISFYIHLLLSSVFIVSFNSLFFLSFRLSIDYGEEESERKASTADGKGRLWQRKGGGGEISSGVVDGGSGEKGRGNVATSREGDGDMEGSGDGSDGGGSR